MKNFETILFDLDGTLTNSSKGIINSYLYAAEKMGVEAPPLAVIEKFVGPPLRGNLLSFIPEEKIEEAVEHYLFSMRKLKRAVLENEVYDGIHDLLNALYEGGKTLYIATSKVQDLSVDIVQHYGWARYFKGVYGAKPDGNDAQKDRVIATLMQERALDPTQSVMIGDRRHDMQGAKKNGLTAIGVGWGYGSREELEQAGADEFAESPSDLRKWFLED